MHLLPVVGPHMYVCTGRFPGSDSAYHALTECCDATLLAEVSRSAAEQLSQVRLADQLTHQP